ncbi:MAG: hypothetical protein N5P05_001863 [Chroococcopsis gigantea SAG 12.99]|nr:hypothetical protein [Chroococcopsis gigantea SAG 12.99]
MTTSTSVKIYFSIYQTMKNIRNLILSVALVSLVACSSTQEATNPSPAESPVAIQPEATAPSPPTLQLPPASPLPTGATPAAPEGLDPAKISFESAPKGAAIGFIDTINGVPAKNIDTVGKNTPIKLSGWATLPDSNTPAELVIITTPDKKIIATTPVNIDRPDVAKALKKDEFKKSGWTVTIPADKITGDKVSIVAWAYNSSTGKAIPLSNIAQLTMQ